MSRIGRAPVQVPAGVTVALDGQRFAARGPLGELEMNVKSPISVEWGEEKGRTLVVSRPTDQKHHRALHGLTRALVANMVEGVSTGFSKTLQIVGVGYRAKASGGGLTLELGFSHPVEVAAPEGIAFEVPNQTTVVVKGPDKQRVGHVAAEIRALRPPEPYKGKGIRYQGEHVRRKAGKTAGS